jgi:signal transduction histidine kinase
MARRRRPRPPRTRSIRTTLASLLVLPVVALIGLWALLASITIGNALTEHNDNRQADSIGSASDKIVAALELERSETFLWLSNPKRGPVSELTSSRRADDAEIAAYERIYPSSLSSRNAVFAQLGKLVGIRTAVDARTLSATTAFQDYDALVDGLFAAYADTSMPDVSLYQHTLGALDAGRALEQFTRELTLSAAAQFDGGKIPAADVTLFANAVSSQRLLEGDAVRLANGQLQANLLRLFSSPTHAKLAALEDQISNSASRAVPLQTLIEWGQVAPAFLKQFEAITESAAIPIGTEAGQISRSLFLEAGLAGGLGLVAVAGVILLMLRFGRRIRNELTDLHDGAETMARERLPGLVERLLEGDDVDAATASPPLPTGRITEIARVADSFSAVQRTAVSAAVGQASMRKGVSKVFLNLSLRNQSILHRQLAMLDGLERATDDPAALANLFRLDHLTTRMRRHAESLIVLSGSMPSRSRQEPVRLVDVVRAAVAEVEDYTRVDVAGESGAAVIGPVASDVVHLLAELVENATSFSPPHTNVEIRLETVGAGAVVEVEDRGLGLTKSELAKINARLASPPGFDLVASDHLGLFVVGQLAARHGITVGLRRSQYGGVTAVVLLPLSLIVPVGQAASTGTSRLASRQLAALSLGEVGGQSPSGSYRLDGGPASYPGVVDWAAAPTSDPDTRGPFEPLRRQDASTYRGHDDSPPHGPGQESSAAPAHRLGSGSAQAGTHRGLPRRVRQASLAPALRNGNAPTPGLEASPDDVTGPSPEQTRTRLSSLQDGWQRGRSDELHWPGDGVSDRTSPQPEFLDVGDGDMP